MNAIRVFIFHPPNGDCHMATKLDKYLSAALGASLPPKTGDRIAYYSLTGRIVAMDRKHYTIELDSMASLPLHTKLLKVRRQSMAIIKIKG